MAAGLCIFCGGLRAATTVEHCPPRALFQNKIWPEGHSFPACKICNEGTRNHDLLFALLARMDPITQSGNNDAKVEGLMRRAEKQFPGILSRMKLSTHQARTLTKTLGLTRKQGRAYADIESIKMPEEFSIAVQVVCAKLVKGIYHIHSGTIFPAHGEILLQWFTNFELFERGTYSSFDALTDLRGASPALVNARRDLKSQFDYKFSLSENSDTMILQSRFSFSFGAVIFASTISGAVDSMLADYAMANPVGQCPFSRIQ